MQCESDFLRSLLGKPIRITAADERCLPPMPSLVLREVSALGVVVSSLHTRHFFPWHEIVEIHPADEDIEAQEALMEEPIEALLGVDTEP